MGVAEVGCVAEPHFLTLVAFGVGGGVLPVSGRGETAVVVSCLGEDFPIER